MTGRHWGPKRTLRLVTDHRHYNACPIYASCSYVAPVWYRALSLHMCPRKFNVWASSSPPRLPLCHTSFLSCPHCWASLRRKIVWSITHSRSLFDTLGSKGYRFV